MYIFFSTDFLLLKGMIDNEINGIVHKICFRCFSLRYCSCCCFQSNFSWIHFVDRLIQFADCICIRLILKYVRNDLHKEMRFFYVTINWSMDNQIFFIQNHYLGFFDQVYEWQKLFAKSLKKKKELKNFSFQNHKISVYLWKSDWVINSFLLSFRSNPLE